MFLKTDTVGIIPKAGYRQAVEALQWLAYIGRTKNNITHTGNGREVHLPSVPNVRIDVYCAELGKSFRTWDVFVTIINVCPIDLRPSATLTKPY